jgi:xanthine dehydrogenase accessory factor
MMTAAMSRRAQELAAQGVAFVTATVVHVQRPTSVEAGNVALVLGDGTIEGFVGGACTEHSVRAYSLQALTTGEALLLRILPFDEDEGPAPDEVVGDDGTVTVQNPCLSGGAIEIFLEPVLPAPRVLVVGETPIASAVVRIGAELGLDVVAVDGQGLEPRGDDLALVVAAHGRDELHTLRRGLEAGLPYVGLVASRKRGNGVLAELRGDGVRQEQLAQIDVPAGLDIGASTPAEIALSILAKIVAVRRDGRVVASRPPVAVSAAAANAAPLAVDPICGMTVAAVAGTPSLQHEGETVYFCCEGCKAKFEAQHEHAGASD